MELIKDESFYFEIVRCGEYISDITIDNNDGCWRSRVISYDDKLYQHVMLNGSIYAVFELKE